jgi:putative ABC transport system ATP-binding protein
LTKVSEERLGNVRTAQSFNGEIQEVNRYNKKIRDLFELGKKEGFANALFFSGVIPQTTPTPHP